MLDKVKPAAIGARPASVSVNFWQPDGAEDNPSQISRQVIRAELTGADTCTARGITNRSSTPVLAMCRRLIEAGCEAPKARNQFARWLDEQEAARVKKNDAQAAS